MSQYPISYLTGNCDPEAAALHNAYCEDANVPYVGGLSDEVAAEMAAAFGWDEPPTDAELDEQYEADRRSGEAEIAAKYPRIANRTDDELIGIIADGPFTLPGEDADEIIAAATIELQKRLAGIVGRKSA